MKIKDLILCIVSAFFGLFGLFMSGMFTGIMIENVVTWEICMGVVLGLVDCIIGIYSAVAHFIASATDHK